MLPRLGHGTPTCLALPAAEGSPYIGPGNTNLSFGGKNVTLLAVAGPGATAIDCQRSAACRAFVFTAADGQGAQVSGMHSSWLCWAAGAITHSFPRHSFDQLNAVDAP